MIESYFSIFFVGTNALPIWTMTDLLQINGDNNDLTNPLATTIASQTNNPIICPAAELHTKRSAAAQLTAHTTAASKASIKTNLLTAQSNGNHKRPSMMDTNAHKRQKCSSNTTVRMSQLAHNASKSASATAINYYPQSYQLQKPKTAPHLLQHLMTATPHSRKTNELNVRTTFGNDVRRTYGAQTNEMNWSGDNGQQQQQQQQNALYQQLQCANGGSDKIKFVDCQPSSNSVLKNLLVSGCDLSAGYICAVPMRTKKTAKA